MKTLTLCLMTTFCAFFSFAQSQNNQSINTFPHRQSQLFLNSDRAQLASIENFESVDYSFRRENISNRCERAKKMRTTGIILASVGGASLITGISLIAIATNDVLNNNSTNFNDAGFYVGGVLFIIAGVGCSGAGIPLAIIGSKKAKKYCGQSKESSYMQLSTKGTSLALSF